MINKTKFYSEVRRNLSSRLSTKQVEGFEAILNGWDANNVVLYDLRYLAYMLATTWHETATTMQPIEEFGRGKTKDYGRKLKMGGGSGKRIPYDKPDKLYYGRGFVQLTWYENYEKAGQKLGVDFLNYPELVMNLDYATDILKLGMLEGWFTGKKLSDYFGIKTDWINARRIINGMDKAKLIASYAKIFFKAVQF